MPTASVILAAGKGTRMQSDLPKVLHPLGGAPMLHHAMRAAAALEPARTVIVTGHGAEAVGAAARANDEDAVCVVQGQQLGTAHAVEQARDALEDFEGDVIVLYGDTPFISPETLTGMQQALQSADLVVLGFEAADPARYGRLVTQGDDLLRIVEYKDASPKERAIRLCNSGVIACSAARLFDLVSRVENDNAAAEYYLTDIVGLANAQGLRAAVMRCAEGETLGINSPAELSRAEAVFQTRARAQLLENGVSLDAPDTLHLSFDTAIGRGARIEPYVVIAPGVTVESGAHIRAFSHLEGCHVSRGAVVGPYARLRPGAELGEDVRIGNFVEVKNAVLEDGAKVNHLSYIGDASIGARSNIGAGTITCNYDGVLKHRTTIGTDAFVGSSTMLVAPVTIGDGAMTGSGSVITANVPADALALGRAPQVTKPGFAARLRDMLRARKKKQETQKQQKEQD